MDSNSNNVVPATSAEVVTLTIAQVLVNLIGRKRDVYICTPMCASARVAPSNIVYLWYAYRSTGISVLNTEIGF